LLIPLIAQRMNNYRLSTNKARSALPSVDNKLLDNGIHNLLESPSNYEVQADNRIKILSTGTYLPNSNGVELYDETGVLVNSFDYQTQCAQFLGVSTPTISR
jgi:hypothetical protein